MSVALAVVGLGGWGPNLVRNAAETKGARLAALCDTDDARLAAVGGRYPGVALKASLGEVLADSSIDAVILATPAGLHADQARQVLESGRHVLVEKPLALTTREGCQLAALAGRLGRVLLTGHTFLYNESVRACRRLIEGGELGKVWFANAERMSLGKVRDDVNALWNLSPHDVSILLHLFGEMPRRVWARGGRFLPGSTQEDVVVATLEFPSGALANITASWLNPLKVRRMTLVGERRMVVYDDTSADRPVVLYDMGVDSEAPEPAGDFQAFRRTLRRGEERVIAVEPKEPLAEEIAHFVRCIAEGEAPVSGPREAIAVVYVLEACQQSLRTDGAPVNLSHNFDFV
ncbi:MAG: Gfo/Idh/MocA family oxidoreductase [Sumerlaeia bacterium]